MRVLAEIKPDDPNREAVRRLIEAHLFHSHEHSPPTSVHAMDVGELKSATVQFWTAEGTDGAVLAMGALKDHGDGLGEVKSMHVREDQRGRGLADDIITHIISVARASGMNHLKLETGSMDAYAPARKLYQRHGFEFCPPFADYVEDPNSVFMTLVL